MSMRTCLCVGHDHKTCKTVESTEMPFACEIFDLSPNIYLTAVHTAIGVIWQIRLNNPCWIIVVVVA